MKTEKKKYPAKGRRAVFTLLYVALDVKSDKSQGKRRMLKRKRKLLFLNHGLR